MNQQATRTKKTGVPARGVNGYENGRARKEAILAAAFEFFAHHGYNGASLRDIAAKSGISHPGLRHHFGTKEELLLAVLDRREQRHLARLELQAAAGRSALDFMVDLIRYNVTEPGMNELFARLSVEASDPEHPAHAYFMQRYARIRRIIEQWLEEAIAQGEVVPNLDVPATATTLIALMDGLQIQWLLAGDSIDSVAIFTTTFHCLTRRPQGA